MKTLIEKLTAKNFRATPAEIKELSRQRFDGEALMIGAGGTYLKALVAVTVVELGEEPRERAASKGRFPKLKAEDIKTHLEALDKVHEVFYEAVLEGLPEGLTAEERNSKSNYARSSKSMLRAWIAEGNDVRALAPARVTKDSLKVERPNRPPNPEQVKRVILRQATALATTAVSLAKVDRQAAVAAIEAAIAQLAARLTTIGVEPTRDANVAIAEHRPFRNKNGLFWPANIGASDGGEVRAAA